MSAFGSFLFIIPVFSRLATNVVPLAAAMPGVPDTRAGLQRGVSPKAACEGMGKAWAAQSSSAAGPAISFVSAGTDPWQHHCCLRLTLISPVPFVLSLPLGKSMPWMEKTWFFFHADDTNVRDCMSSTFPSAHRGGGAPQQPEWSRSADGNLQRLCKIALGDCFKCSCRTS